METNIITEFASCKASWMFSFKKITQYDWKGGNAGLSTAIDQGIDTENITKLLKKYALLRK